MRTTAKRSKVIVQGTKKYIINVARRLFSESSYLGVSMNDIAKKLNITKPALYYHFSGKAEIYKEVLNQVFNDLSLSIKTSLKKTTNDKKLFKLIKNYLDFGLKEKNLIKILILKLPPANLQIKKQIIQLKKQIFNLIHSVIKKTLLNKKTSSKIDSESLTFLLTSIMNGLLLEYLFLNKKINSEKISNQIIMMLFQKVEA